ncbi:hypothetical protein AB9K26_05860 [Psychroserpens sp. XS_ASV72]|uniref:hypothetical protein n=1 Tax=Psychroserpens sp. XS_ASV72 TaxID=3241293 RepID=UPI003512F676
MKFINLFFLCCSLSFSQTNPKTVEPFLDPILKQFPNVRDIAINSSENEVFFSVQSTMGEISALVTARKTSTGWENPEVLSFSGQFFDIEPFLSEDALTLYFVSNRPLDSGSTETKDFDIWYVSRNSIEGKWSEPQNIGAPINTEMDEFYPVITASKNLYFTLDDKAFKQRDDIYVSEFKNGTYTTPRSLGGKINSEGYEFNAYVSPDESFLIYTCYNRPDGFGSGDLYISYKEEDGSWTESKNMGNAVNSDKMDYCPFVNLKTNTLYFTSKRITEKQSPDKKLNIEELKTLFNSFGNGSSRLYKTHFKPDQP